MTLSENPALIAQPKLAVTWNNASDDETASTPAPSECERVPTFEKLVLRKLDELIDSVDRAGAKKTDSGLGDLQTELLNLRIQAPASRLSGDRDAWAPPDGLSAGRSDENWDEFKRPVTYFSNTNVAVPMKARSEPCESVLKRVLSSFPNGLWGDIVENAPKSPDLESFTEIVRWLRTQGPYLARYIANGYGPVYLLYVIQQVHMCSNFVATNDADVFRTYQEFVEYAEVELPRKKWSEKLQIDPLTIKTFRSDLQLQHFSKSFDMLMTKAVYELSTAHFLGFLQDALGRILEIECFRSLEISDQLSNLSYSAYRPESQWDVLKLRSLGDGQFWSQVEAIHRLVCREIRNFKAQLSEGEFGNRGVRNRPALL